MTTSEGGQASCAELCRQRNPTYQQQQTNQPACTCRPLHTLIVERFEDEPRRCVLQQIVGGDSGTLIAHMAAASSRDTSDSDCLTLLHTAWKCFKSRLHDIVCTAAQSPSQSSTAAS